MTLDLLITGARVRTFDTAMPWAEAVGVTDGRIAYVQIVLDRVDRRRDKAQTGHLALSQG